MDICSVKGEFEKVKIIEKNYTFGPYWGQWFLIKMKPLPIDNLDKILIDIRDKSRICVDSDTRISHDPSCSKIHNSLSGKMKTIMKNLKDIEYKIAVYNPYELHPERTSLVTSLGSQPLVFVLDPVINFQTYPLHPHLNGFYPGKIPTSICYTDEPNSLGDTFNCRAELSIKYVSTWLLSHQIWEMQGGTKNITNWFNPDSNENYFDYRAYYIYNPHGLCRCGSGKLYKNCHLNEHLIKNGINPLTKFEIIELWKRHMNFEREFREFFLPLFE